MEVRIRTSRTLKVTEVPLSAEEQESLAQLYLDPRYEMLLNVMERACISVETAHLNTSVGNPEEILGGHALAKSSWLFFTYVQKQVANAFNMRTGEQAEVKPETFEELIQGVNPIAAGSYEES